MWKEDVCSCTQSFINTRNLCSNSTPCGKVLVTVTGNTTLPDGIPPKYWPASTVSLGRYCAVLPPLNTEIGKVGVMRLPSGDIRRSRGLGVDNIFIVASTWFTRPWFDR